jgi:antirestriction protein ArdC
MLVIKNINEIVVNSLRQGNIPWKTFDLGFPTNVFTKKKYSGINPILLQISSQKYKFKRSKYWGSLRQWQGTQCGVPFDQQPTLIFVYQEFEKSNQHFKSPSTKKVFNADQVFGLTVGDFFGGKVSNDYSQIECLVGKSEVIVKEGATPLYYDGTITMPPKSHFKNEAQYWSTYLHELCHHWELRVGFMGDELQRELVAEIATGYLEGILELCQCTDRENHDKYLSQWLEEADKNPNYLVNSASIATQIVRSLMNLVNSKDFSYAQW